MSFKSIGVSKEIIKILASKGITEPTDVQKGCIKHIIDGRDLVACAKTGSGKTATFLIPILQSLMCELVPMYALILTPTRELAFQIGEQAAGLNLVHGTSLCKVMVITGGRDMVRQGLELSRQPHVIVATPGRLADLLRTRENQQTTSAAEWSLDRLKVFVMDEADRLLEDAFGEDIACIMGALCRRRQTLLFSATLTDSVRAACEGAAMQAEKEHRRPPIMWQPEDQPDGNQLITTVDTLAQYYVLMRPEHKESFLLHILVTFLEENPHSLVIVFSNKCKWVHLLGIMLEKLGLKNVVLHSSMPQRNRIESLGLFKSSQVRVLIATDLVSRGLDFPTVDAVINHNVPLHPKDYVHRVGRTARAGKSGIAITLTDLFEVKRLQGIQDYIGKKLKAFQTNEKKVAEIITEVSIARRDAERVLDHIKFEEKQEIAKAKKKLKRAAAEREEHLNKCSKV